MANPDSLPNRVAHKLARSLPARLVDIVPVRTIVSFTFDDVPASALRFGVPALEKHGVRGTFYVAGGVAGGELDGLALLDAEDYRDLAQRGHEIGHHTFSHRLPVSLGLGYGADLRRNDEYLSALGVKARNFAFPYGRSAPWAQYQLSRRFRSSRGVEEGINRGTSNLDMLKVAEMRGNSTVSGLTRWIDDAAEAPAWIIYLAHGVVESDPGEFEVRADVFEQVVAHAAASGADILTVDAALDRLGID